MFLQLLCHLWGDYVFQSSWMANNKTKHWWPATVHASIYFVPFLIVFKPSLMAAIIMIGTHAAIDHWRLAKHVAFTSQHLAPPSQWQPWSSCQTTGYPPETPVWLATWLMIIVDNTMHLTINALSLAYL